MFGVIGVGGTIENLRLENVNINGKTFVGGIAGTNRGTIESVFVSGNISGDSDVGGIAGNNEGKILNSQSQAVIFVRGAREAVSENERGIVGRNSGIVRNSESKASGN
jgi:hypothetical protein